MEYEPYGNAWVRRADASHEWEPCAQDSVPAEVVAHIREELPERRRLSAAGIHPDGNIPFAVIHAFSDHAEAGALDPGEPDDPTEQADRLRYFGPGDASEAQA